LYFRLFKFVVAMKKLLIVVMLGGVLNSAFAQHTLFIPDTLSGTTFNLTVHPDSVQFKPGVITKTFGINTNKYLGPTLIMHKGDSVSITVNNQIGDTTTMHWHGLHVAPKNDGGPFSMVMHGMSWNPQFVVRNNASTYWYHPHMMAKTAAQAIKGDAGLIIIRDNDEAALNLPRRYGVDDFPIIVQSVELDTTNQFMPKGMVDSVELVNGTDSAYVNIPAQVVRMRLLNASGERTYNFGFTANKSFNVIGNDAGLLQAPVATTRIRLSPGERAEILLDLDGMIGQTIYLMSYASELPMGVQGGPTMPMPPSSPPMNSPLNGIDFNLLQINVVTQTTSPVTTIPTSLVADTPYSVSMATTSRYIMMSADSLMVMDGPFYFNGNSFDMNRIDYHIPLNNIEIWTLKDSTMVAHPFHIHDVHFYILDRNGNPPDAVERGRKDVLLIQPNETVRFITKFEDFADTTTPYMYHCHILMHEDDGMMGQFKVGTSYTFVNNNTVATNNILIYPNPASKSININIEGTITENADFIVYDAMGRKVYEGSFIKNLSLNMSEWDKGLYTVSVRFKDNTIHKKFIVE
jgi:blue copper oxidase